MARFELCSLSILMIIQVCVRAPNKMEKADEGTDEDTIVEKRTHQNSLLFIRKCWDRAYVCSFYTSTLYDLRIILSYAVSFKPLEGFVDQRKGFEALLWADSVSFS